MYKRIFNHFGKFNQLQKLYEELNELKAELTGEANNNYISEDRLIDEMADVYIILSQFKKHYGKRFIDRVKIKLSRTKERIKEGYYENRTK